MILKSPQSIRNITHGGIIKLNLTEKIVANGDFWFPDTPKEKTGGTLTIDEHGIISLVLFDYPGGTLWNLERLESVDYHNTNRPIPPTTIYGYTFPFGLVTLENCLDQTQMYHLPPPSPLSFTVQRAILGAHINDISNLKVSKVVAGIKSLHEWLGITALDFQIDDDRRGISANIRLPNDITILTFDAVEIKFTFELAKPGDPFIAIGPPSLNMEQHTLISLTPINNTTFDDLIKLTTRVRDFISLGIGKPVNFTSFSAYSDVLTHPPYPNVTDPTLIHCIFNDGIRNDSLFTGPDIYMSFHYDMVSTTLAPMLNRWLENYNDLSESFNLYNAVNGAILDDPNITFLWMTQVLESLHRDFYRETALDASEYERRLQLVGDKFSDHVDVRRWLLQRLQFANEVTQRNRLKKLCGETLPNDESRKLGYDLADDVVDARNWLVHRDEKIVKGIRIVESGRIPRLTEFLVALFQLWNLRQIGFGDDGIEDVLARNSDLGELFGYENVNDAMLRN